MIFAYIVSKTADISVWRACQLMGVSESGFYAWRRRPACQRQVENSIAIGGFETCKAVAQTAERADSPFPLSVFTTQSPVGQWIAGQNTVLTIIAKLFRKPVLTLNT